MKPQHAGRVVTGTRFIRSLADFPLALVDESEPDLLYSKGSASYVWPACSAWLCCNDPNPVALCLQDVLAETCLRFRWSFPVGMQAEATKRSALVLDLRSGFRADLRNDCGATVVRLI